MEFYTPRKLKFKAWNVESRLLMRLNAIDCVKGELMKKGHILLQYTEMTDKQGEELYEMDVVLLAVDKFVITWGHNPAGWYITKLADPQVRQIFPREHAHTTIRLCNYFETQRE